MLALKVVVFLAVMSIAVAGPVKPKHGRLKKAHQKLMEKELMMSTLLQDQWELDFKFPNDSMSESQEYKDVNFRLPNNTIPLHYNIKITTDDFRRGSRFQGLTRITIRATEPSATITLHSVETTFYRIDLFNAEGEMIDANLYFKTDTSLDFLIIPLRQPLVPGQEVILQIKHSSQLQEDSGFYSTAYLDRDTLRWQYIGTTLFEPTNARFVFPCYDEIRFRATFDISIVHRSRFHALSNMPVARTETDGGMTTTFFERTPPMPTYNVAFTISDLAFISNNNETLPMRVYASPEEIKSESADSALELGQKMWGALENIFEIPYPLPKTDMVATDNLRNVESWGLIKIDSWVLLSSDPVVSISKRMQIAHEYTVSTTNIQPSHVSLISFAYQHTYFSNLVSPADWSYLW
jgi:aminopeptidase N